METKRLSRYQRSKNAPAMHLTERDKQVILAVYQHRLLRRDQIEQLFFTQTSACNQRLMRLYQHGYLRRIFKPVSFGASQAIYAIDKHGARLVIQELGIPHSQINWKPKQRPVELMFLEHTLAIAEVYINLAQWIQKKPDTDLLFWKRESKELTDRVSDPEGKLKHLSIAPDAFFGIQTPAGKSYFFIEVDMGTMALTRYRRKIIAYRQYWKTGKYSQVYGFKSFRVITIALSEQRLANLEQVARDAGGRNMFLFCNANSLSDMINRTGDES